MEARKRVGSNVQKLRRQKGLSQEALAHSSGLHQTYLSGVETGRRNPSVGVLERLATALEIDISEFFVRVGNQKSSNPQKT